ncbi:RICIN domain-containing protein [Mycobacteroides chelonae]|uniref:RICIN domain-containing protein n=1 Tax=Mycobacteroides chelonae TaxID=1774 RepID=UPI0009BF3D98|nr:RICIN domain-containing protein [Mycobacteroides chelonae]
MRRQEPNVQDCTPTLALAFCVPEVTEKKPDTVRKFIPQPWDGIYEDARRQVKWLEQRAQDPTAAPTEFKPSVRDTRLEPGSAFHGFRETAGHMNKALGETFGAVGYYAWLKGLVSAFAGDADALSKAAAVTGIVPVVGDFMGILDGAVHGNWEELALSGVGLLVVLASQAVPVVGEVLDVALGVYLVATELAEVVKEISAGLPGELDVMREKRDQAWWSAVVKRCDERIIPTMEQAWRRYEQSVLCSFAQTLAFIDLKAAQLTEQCVLSEAQRVEAAGEITAAKSQLWARLGWFLVDAAARFQAQMQTTLWQMLTDQQNFSDFTVEAVKQLAASWSSHVYINCVDMNPDEIDGKCRELQQRQYAETMKQGEQMHGDTVPDELPDEVYVLFDKNGRFWPRVLPPAPLPVPHITAARASDPYTHQATVSWVPPKTLPRPLISKVRLEVRGEDIPDQGAPASAGWLTFTDYKSTTENPKHHAVDTHFATPDIAEFPQVLDPKRMVDRKWQSTVSRHWHINDAVSPDCDLSNIPRNEGYGPLSGDYVILSEAGGMVVDVCASSTDEGAAVVQSLATGAGSQIWNIASDEPTAEAPNRRKSSLVINTNSGKCLSDEYGFEPDDGDKLGQRTVVVGASQQRWFPELVPTGSDRPDEGFLLRNDAREKLVMTSVTPSSDPLGDQLRVTLANSMAKQRWQFVPTGIGVPAAGRYYTVVNSWNGLAIDMRGPGNPTLQLPNQASPTQVFRLELVRDASDDYDRFQLRSPLHERLLEVDPAGKKQHDWHIRYRGGGACTWKLAVDDAKALGVDGSSRAPGSQLALKADTGDLTQTWQLSEVVMRPNVGLCTITSPSTGLAATAVGDNLKDPCQVRLEKFDGKRSQLWDIHTYAGAYVIKCLGTDGLLAVEYGSEEVPVVVITAPQTTIPTACRWQLVPAPSGALVMVNLASGHVLDIERKSQGSGALLVQRAPNDGVNQTWSLTTTRLGDHHDLHPRDPICIPPRAG